MTYYEPYQPVRIKLQAAVDLFFIVLSLCALWPVLKIIDAWEWVEKK